MKELKHDEKYEMDCDYDKDNVIIELFDILDIDTLLTLYFYAEIIKSL